MGEGTDETIVPARSGKFSQVQFVSWLDFVRWDRQEQGRVVAGRIIGNGAQLVERRKKEGPIRDTVDGGGA